VAHKQGDAFYFTSVQDPSLNLSYSERTDELLAAQKKNDIALKQLWKIVNNQMIIAEEPQAVTITGAEENKSITVAI